MEFLTLFCVIMTCLICGALAATAFGFRPTTFEQAVAASATGEPSSSSGDRLPKKKKPKKQATTSKRGGLKKNGVDESDEDDSMPDEDVAVGLLHARGISVKTTSETAALKSSPNSSTVTASVIGIPLIHP